MFSKNLHLVLSAMIVIVAAFIYGASPSVILPQIFDFQVDNLELKNIFRAKMGLYLGMAAFWLIGVFRPQYWKAATLVNILFMGGLALGRFISTVVDGWSLQYGIGMLLELLFM